MTKQGPERPRNLLQKTKTSILDETIIANLALQMCSEPCPWGLFEEMRLQVMTSPGTWAMVYSAGGCIEFGEERTCFFSCTYTANV